MTAQTLRTTEAAAAIGVENTLASDAVTRTLTVDADTLARALKVTSHGLRKGTRGGLPVDRAVQLTATPSATLGVQGTLTLTTFNRETSLRVSLPADQLAAELESLDAASGVSTLVGHPDLRESLKGLPRGARVTLSLTASDVTVSTPAGASVLRRIGECTFPDPPERVSDAGALELFTVPAADLAAGIKAVNRSASTDMTLPVLCGLGVHAVPGEPVTVSATDRYRYTRWDSGTVWAGRELGRPRIVLPARVVAAVCAALPRQVGADTPVTLTVDAAAAAGTGDGWATLSTGTGSGRGQVSATFAVIDGEYPRVEALWPAAVAHTLQVPAAALAAVARQTAALQPRNRPIALHLAADAVTVATDPGALPDPTTGSVMQQYERVPLPPAAPGRPANFVNLNAPVGLNPMFLADALDSVSGTVTLAGAKNELRPWTFTDDGPVRVLLMPVRLPNPAP